MALQPGNHGIIVIHGIGENTKSGHLLADITNSLADSLVESPDQLKRKPKVRREVNLDGNPPSVTLHITSPDGNEDTKWIFKEAFWDDAFPPPKASTVLWRLLTNNLLNHIQYLRDIIERDPTLDKTFIPEKDKVDEIDKYGELTDWTADRGKYNIRLKMAPTPIWIFLLAGIVYLLLFFVWICQYIPSIGPLEKVIKWVRKLDPFLSNSFGDVHVYMEHKVWRANARRRLEEIIIDMLNKKPSPEEEINDITIIAHSMGCVVTYDALAEGGEVASKIQDLKADPKWKQKKITFVSVGSAINQVFNLYAADEFKQRPLAPEITGSINKRSLSNTGKTPEQLEKELKKQIEQLKEQFDWLDLCARRDPVPAGELDERIIEYAVAHEKQVKRRKVINKDNIFLDHSYYWANKDTVMPRIVRAINGGKEYPWIEAGVTQEKRARRIQDIARFGRLTRVFAFVVAVGIVVLIVLKLNGVI